MMKKVGLLLALMVGLTGVWMPQTVAAPVTITHSDSLTVNQALNCLTVPGQPDTSWYRVFHLPDFGIDGQFTVASVDIGVGNALAPSGQQPLTVNLYTLSGEFVLANLTPIGSNTVSVADGVIFSIITIPVVGVAPPGSTLVVEIFFPDGTVTGNRFSIGANGLGETGLSYFRCGDLIPVPTPVPDFFPLPMHFVMQVHGDAAPPAAELCHNLWTGALSTPRGADGCPAGTRPVSIGGAQSTPVCIKAATGEMYWFMGQPCPPAGWLTRVVPDQGPLNFCAHNWTGGLRAIFGAQTCHAYETPGQIPA